MSSRCQHGQPKRARPGTRAVRSTGMQLSHPAFVALRGLMNIHLTFPSSLARNMRGRFPLGNASIQRQTSAMTRSIRCQGQPERALQSFSNHRKGLLTFLTSTFQNASDQAEGGLQSGQSSGMFWSQHIWSSISEPQNWSTWHSFSNKVCCRRGTLRSLLNHLVADRVRGFSVVSRETGFFLGNDRLSIRRVCKGAHSGKAQRSRRAWSAQKRVRLRQ